MALSTYATLQTSVAGWVNRSDLTAQVPDFIALAESKLNTRLSHRSMETISTISITGETYTLPTDFAGVVSLRISITGQQRLDYVSQEQFDDLPINAAGTPTKYTIAGGSLVFWPIPGAATAARLRYRTRIPALSATNTTNWLLTAYPHAYLYGALLETAPYLKDDNRTQLWGALFAEAVSDVNNDGLRQGLGAVLQTQSGVAD
jgi:hypothetical protein